MKVEIITDNLNEIESQILILPVFSDDRTISGKLIDFDRMQGGMIQRLLDWGDIKGKYKEFTMFYTANSSIQRVLIIGLGEKKDFTLDRLRSVIAIASRNCRRLNSSSMSIYGHNIFGVEPSDYGRAILEGIYLGLYKFTKYLSKSTSSKFFIDNLKIIIDNKEILPSLSAGINEGKILGETTNFARDLVNEPSSYLTPEKFSEYAKNICEEYKMEIKILEKEDMEKFGMGGILAVGQGSNNPPKLVIMKYMNNPGGKTIGLVGKGMTFDSGGMSIKTRQQLFRMNSDMAGAATVLCAIKSIAAMNIKCNIVGVMPLAENMPDGKSYKVSDIIRTYEGKTVEILDTDAEGRLILADGLTCGRKEGADILIDVATLTGSIVIALGHQTSGIMGSDEELINRIISGGEKAGELFWQLPLFKEYKMQIESDVADLENYGGSPAGAITAAMFLQEFTGGLPWAHLDIAGTSVTDEEIMIYVKNPYLPKEGGTGVGVRTLYHYIKDLSLI